ncbi:hypothetical protein HFP51_08205 [Parasphingopyxis sp. CP4]|uniref:hypothetical protein n=1 Tax=Parasphingopyxis sp. CP4 TaxID=2724527 RepID=UPI0015A46000|nr:hypothetical protein [Parasphingopyxis sp. CP4]QLC22159.1 hypothetical protein HFP51_08205 [Parasphingopyxis sp. CP4]
MYHGSGGDSAVFDPECTISANGVAGIGLPLTLGEFANGFSNDTAMIYGHVYFDYAELCVLHQGRRAICALFEADDFNRHRLSFENNYAYEPSISVVALVVRAPHCRTQAGVGPGTDLVAAEGAYGDAVFDTERDAETRDFITFENAPPNLRFESDYADDPHSETDVVLMPSEEREQRLAREANERAEQPEPRQNVRIGKVWIYPTD